MDAGGALGVCIIVWWFYCAYMWGWFHKEIEQETVIDSEEQEATPEDRVDIEAGLWSDLFKIWH